MDERPRPREGWSRSASRASLRQHREREELLTGGSSVSARHLAKPGPHASEGHRTRSSKVPWGGTWTWRPTSPSIRMRERDEAPTVRAVSLATRLLEVEALVPASHAPPVTQERAQAWSPPCSARHWRGRSDTSPTDGRTRDTPRGLSDDDPARCGGETAGQMGVRRQGLEPRTR
jgi:hypothetical protein